MRFGLLLLIFFLLNNPFTQAQFNIITPAEFEKNEGVLLVWDYSSSRDSITANIAKAAQTAGKVWIIYYPGQAPMDTFQIRNYLYGKGVTPENLFFIPGWTETLWIRDFGPLTNYASFGNNVQRYILDPGYSAYGRPKDDSIPAQLANLWGWNHIDLGLQLEGGNLIFDGLKRGFGSKRIWDQNPSLSPVQISNLLRQKFNLADFVFLDNLNNSGGGIWKHVDMYMRMLDYETILVSSYPDHLPDYPIIEANVMLLSNLTNHFGEPYKIYRIPAPPKADGTWATTQNDEMRTYTNSLILNNTVIVPSYGLPEWDNQAKQIYERLMSGYEVKMVDSQMLTILGGAVHCVTKEVPAERYIRIVHKKVTETQSLMGTEFEINCMTYSADPIESIWLHYKKSNETEFSKVPIWMVCPEYMGVIQGLSPGDTVNYYIQAKTYSDSITYPLSAPEGYFTFWSDLVSASEISQNDTFFRIIPNPSNGTIYLNPAPEVVIKTYEVFDLSGRRLIQGRYHQHERLQFDLETGMYLLNIETSNGNQTQRLIINR
jgi:agmatine/peptidylarginine deiminase